MYNDLLSIGKFTIHGYGLMIGIGFVLAVLLGAKYAKRRGLSEDAVFSFALLAILSGFGGGITISSGITEEAFLTIESITVCGRNRRGTHFAALDFMAIITS